MNDKFNSLPEDMQKQVKEKLLESKVCTAVNEFGVWYIVDGEPLVRTFDAEYYTFKREDLD